ncbi:prolipoprotein diacylglyceryl transferase [Desulfotalea psychrophila]|uniref:Phosphatidylglycerol--prolipoprotein diacylglyceryl transferase n=1 Tax=Desulfotalea psychrophila (strain LSv54 / DSM 12343) TaxID=177439 RepID=LGT_DESPS|nr:prolipoprotein diacylglyceryl transferase [Desulfotalea psychrophila]Q6APZ3.1 RecName: Full=Phosphatidylglycerol--prolipoprotein diacylglyceryl transferase [Desulfotalea psychrophila LSv54]CAG35580.1 probable prolipoprotein diacylglyceryl transferase [Desulfotalea psychrophila LSv54]
MSYYTLPPIDPIIMSLGPISIRWYGLMYVIGFFATYFLVRQQIQRHQFTQLEKNFDNLNTVLILCVILGGRLGYVVFYNLSYYLQHPLEILATWHGGMSFHGACIALILGGLIFCKIKKIDFWATADVYVATIPIGLGLGRIGNLINGELYGRVTEQPWGIIFPNGGPLPRHASQLYESLLEGLILFIILWSLRNRPWKRNSLTPHGTILSLFLCLYGLFRIIIENFRQPDPQLGFIVAHITMGQLLSGAMILCGLTLWFWRIHQKKRATAL